MVETNIIEEEEKKNIQYFEEHILNVRIKKFKKIANALLLIKNTNTEIDLTYMSGVPY